MKSNENEIELVKAIAKLLNNLAKEIKNRDKPRPMKDAPKDKRILLLREYGWLCGSWNPDSYSKEPRPHWPDDTEPLLGWLPLPDEVENGKG